MNEPKLFETVEELDFACFHWLARIPGALGCRYGGRNVLGVRYPMHQEGWQDVLLVVCVFCHQLRRNYQAVINLQLPRPTLIKNKSHKATERVMRNHTSARTHASVAAYSTKTLGKGRLAQEEYDRLLSRELPSTALQI